MFRCITELKGLVIDVDSFKDNELSDWKEIAKEYKCLFITSDNGTADELEKLFDIKNVLKIEEYNKYFLPNSNTHHQALNILGLKTTEIAYASKDIQFLDHAMGFLCGTIWITDVISYVNASKAPDLVCPELNKLKDILDNDVEGFLGEVAVYPNKNRRGMVIPVEFEVDGDIIPLYMLGRYFGYSHYMSQLHPYSSAIYLNKKEGKAYGIFDDIFSVLYSVAVNQIQKKHEIYGICSVPARPGNGNRFQGITNMIANECKLKNLTDKMICSKDYPTQKNLSQSEREENVEDVFSYNGNLLGKNVIIIDDIISTGSTMRACIRELKNKGANQVFIVVLGVNQMQGSYWSSIDAQVSCPNCNKKMQLLVNSYNRIFFYSCNSCRNKTFDFQEGRKMLCKQVNDEFKI